MYLILLKKKKKRFYSFFLLFFYYFYTPIRLAFASNARLTGAPERFPLLQQKLQLLRMVQRRIREIQLSS